MYGAGVRSRWWIAPELLAVLSRSTALWNRRALDLQSQETVVQLMDRGSIDDWRALAALAANDPALTERIFLAATTVPLASGWFWQAVLASRGHPVPWQVPEEGTW